MNAVFEVRAMADPQSLVRILGHFSQAWLIPQSVESHRIGDEIACRCVIEAMDRGTAIRIARKLEASPLVMAAGVRFLPVD